MKKRCNLLHSIGSTLKSKRIIMAKKIGDVIYCPQCLKPIEPCLQFWITSYSWRSIRLPWFICIDCKLVYLEKSAIRKTVSSWRNASNNTLRRVTYKQIYQEAIALLEEMLDRHCERTNYKKFEKFKKVKRNGN